MEKEILAGGFEHFFFLLTVIIVGTRLFVCVSRTRDKQATLKTSKTFVDINYSSTGMKNGFENGLGFDQNKRCDHFCHRFA